MDFKPMYSYQDIFNAYMDCRRRKRNKRSSIAFEINFEENLYDLLDEVNSGQYQIGHSTVFVATKPKPREIWAASFRDRVVHHLVYNEIGPFFERRFIEDSYACIKNKGTLAASDRLIQFHKRATNNYDGDVWFLQFDIKNFFGSIDKFILWDLLKKHIQSGKCKSLLHQIIFNDPTQNAHIKSCSDFSIVPKHKSLWFAPKGKGLPIGNLTSQFFGNLYLNELDQFIKHNLKVRYYVRYVDDAVIFDSNKSNLQSILHNIDLFLKKILKIELHPDKCFIKKASQGINFVGYIVKPHRRYTRKSTVSSAKKAVEAIQCNPTQHNIASLNSYLGFLIKTKSYKIRRNLCQWASIPSLVAPSSRYNQVIHL